MQIFTVLGGTFDEGSGTDLLAAPDAF